VVACVHVPMVVVVVLELVTVVGVMLVLLDVAGTVEVDDDEELVVGTSEDVVVLVVGSDELDVELVIAVELLVVERVVEVTGPVDEVLVLGAVVTVDVVLARVVDVLVVGGPTHWHWLSQVSPGGQGKAPFGEFGGSHCSPGSSLPLPHVGDVELVVLELVELDVLEPAAWVVLVVPIEVEVVAVVVDVLVVEPAHASVSVTRSLMTFRAKNAPTRVASCVSFKTPAGSVSPVTQIVPFTTAWRATVTLAFEKSWT
jgi:hypothetical protein